MLTSTSCTQPSACYQHPPSGVRLHSVAHTSWCGTLRYWIAHSRGHPARHSALAQCHLHSLPFVFKGGPSSMTEMLQDGGGGSKGSGRGEDPRFLRDSFSFLRELLLIFFFFYWRPLSCFSFSLLPLPIQSWNNFHDRLALPRVLLPPQFPSLIPLHHHLYHSQFWS